jgi:hypothetical protein
MSTYEGLSLLVNLILASAIYFSFRQIKVNKNQLYLSTINKCVDDFKDIGPLGLDITDEKLIYNYLDLTNQELFYFQNSYLPKDIQKEWIDGMIDLLPITNGNRVILNTKYCLKILSTEINRDRLLRQYPRIRNAFEILDDSKYDFDLIYDSSRQLHKQRIEERRKLIAEIIANVKEFDGFK